MFGQDNSTITSFAYLANKKVIISNRITLFEIELSDCVVLGLVFLALTWQLVGVRLVDLRFLLLTICASFKFRFRLGRASLLRLTLVAC
jgi:hypothetical protein